MRHSISKDQFHSSKIVCAFSEQLLLSIRKLQEIEVLEFLQKYSHIQGKIFAFMLGEFCTLNSSLFKLIKMN